jgi:hypothetical protein
MNPKTAASRMKNHLGQERRSKHRFALERELRYKVLESQKVIMAGVGQTIDMSSGGVAFKTAEKSVAGFGPGTLIELSISWPVLLDSTCQMQLVVFGQVVRTRHGVVGCNIEKYEFRTQARIYPAPLETTVGGRLKRWAAAKEIKVAAGATGPTGNAPTCRLLL